MTHSPAPLTSPASAIGLDELASLAEIFATDYRDHDGPPVAVGVVEVDEPRTGDEKGALCLRELLDGDPAREMLGWNAPDDWAGFGLASRALTRHIETRQPMERDVGMAHFVSRSGVVAYALAVPGDDVMVQSSVDDTTEGRVADACRRVLGLPTPPPPHDARALMAVQWLDAAAARAMAADPGSLSWEEVALANPFVDNIIAAEPLLALELPDHLLEFGNAFRRAWSWTRLRAEHQSGRYQGFDLEPAHSAWMDDGMFARWALAWFPPLDYLLGVAEERLSTEVRRRVRLTLRQWELL